MNIRITKFGERHFEKNFRGTKILNTTKEEFEELLDEYFSEWGICEYEPIIHDGYADFCKLVAIKNFTDAKVGSMPITLENYQFIRSGYSARRENELPVFSRWLELPLGKPKAEWLMLVLYSKEQINKELKADWEKEKSLLPLQEFTADWGIVAILGQSHPNEEPMKPETMIRNAGYNTVEFQEKVISKIKNISKNTTDDDIKNILNLQGKMVGGSGTPIKSEDYNRSVEFWSKNITVS